MSTKNSKTDKALEDESSRGFFLKRKILIILTFIRNKI